MDDLPQKSRRAIPANTKAAVLEAFERDGRRCALCGEQVQTWETTHIDHIVPVSRGGTDDVANLRAVHGFCNLSKGQKTDEEQKASTSRSWRSRVWRRFPRPNAAVIRYAGEYIRVHAAVAPTVAAARTLVDHLPTGQITRFGDVEAEDIELEESVEDANGNCIYTYTLTTWLGECVVLPQPSVEVIGWRDARAQWLWMEEADTLRSSGYRVHVCGGWDWWDWTDDAGRAWQALLTDLEQRAIRGEQAVNLPPREMTLYDLYVYGEQDNWHPLMSHWLAYAIMRAKGRDRE
jgi:hypothetical protein